MGDMADFINDQDPFPEDWDNRPATWTTREGDVIQISDMTDSHLINTLRMMDRKGFVPATEVIEYLSGSRPNGDAAMDAWEEGLRELYEKIPSNKMDELAAEAMQRGLEWKQ